MNSLEEGTKASVQSKSLRLSVVLVSFNTRELTLACIKSLLPELELNTDEIILVDNASYDHSVEAVKDAYPTVRVIPLLQNVGFGAANNIGFGTASGRFLLLLNTDTIVLPGSIDSMLQTLESQPTVGAVGCKLQNPDGSLQKSCWSFPSPLRAWTEALGFNRLGIVKDWHQWDHASYQLVDFVIGAALLVRRSVVDQIGGFDEQYFLYAEEADWQRRMHNQGWRIAFNPTHSIVHIGGASGVSLGDRQLVEFCRSTERFIRKYHGNIGLAFFSSAVVFGTAIRWGFAMLMCLAAQKYSRREVRLRKTLRWWLGLGPHEGIKELAAQSASKPNE